MMNSDSKIHEHIENGSKKIIDGFTKVYYDGYWIKYYEAPKDNLLVKKNLIHSLTRRVFNHMEHGINIPGSLLDKTRTAYEEENDPKKKRVKGAMLAGALFNRAADIFTHLVDLETSGVEILPDNDLMNTCGQHLCDALKYGKQVKHRNGDEGIDELWGEPFKAFIMQPDAFYESRYIKIAMTMENINLMATYMIDCIKDDPRYNGLEDIILEFARTARNKCETLRTDDNIFDVWSDFVVAGEGITGFIPNSGLLVSDKRQINVLNIKHLLKAGVRLTAFITRARTPMPESTRSYLKECQNYMHQTN
jgi:hypothetical protein